MRVFLIGFMSCGKSTIGKMLSKALNLPFVDVDTEVELMEGKPLREVFSRGEQYFRKCENLALVKIIEEHEHAIIACGGGTPCFFNNMELIKNSGKSFYIKTKPETLLSRLTFTKNQRPLFKNIPPNQWLNKINELLEIREPYYKQANYIIDGENNTIERIIKCLQYDPDFKT